MDRESYSINFILVKKTDTQNTEVIDRDTNKMKDNFI